MTDTPQTTLANRLRDTTKQMANRCSVDMILWGQHSNACLEAADEIERLRGWLRYIACNFRDGEECASEALDDKPIPEGFEG